MDFKTPPFRHQLECFNLAKDRPYYGLYLSPGTGKTKITIDIVTYRQPDYRVLVVCPNTIVENWAEEVVKHSNLTATTLTGSRAQRLKKLHTTDTTFYIINYESVWRFIPELAAKGFRLLVCDESQALASPKSRQSKGCYELSKYIKHKLILTGTPVMNTPLDLFGQMRVLNDLILGANFYRFRAHHAVMGGYLNKQVVQFFNMDQLRDKIFACGVRMTKEECLDLPDKLYQVIQLELPAEQRRTYDELKAHFITEFQQNIITAPIVLTRLVRFSQITAGFTKDVTGKEIEYVSNPKVDWVVNFVNSLEPTDKVVLFCRFTKEIDLIAKRLNAAHVVCDWLDGRTEGRIERINDFNTNPRVRVLAVQTQTGGVGINLTGASYVVFMTNPYSYGKRVQAEERIHRIGQTKNCTVIDLVYTATIDVSVLKTLKNKQSLSNMVTADLVRMV